MKAEPLGPAGLGQVGPAVVVGVLADVRREGRVEAEELGEERVERVGCRLVMRRGV